MSYPTKLLYLPSIDATALPAVLARWQARFPGMGVCALLPEAQKDSLPLLQAQCAQQSVPLVGGIFPALVKDDAFCTEGVWLLRFDVMPWHLLLAELPQQPQVAQDLMQSVAQQVAAQFTDSRADATLFMLIDCMLPNIGTLLDQLYLHLANRVHYAGANAGSETFTPMACLFDGQRMVHNGLLLLLLPDHKGAILEHGYHAPAQRVYATSTQGNCITQIDWRPAFEVYQELVSSQFQVQMTPENFYAHAVHFPFGIVRANQQVVVRIPVKLHADGSLYCVGEVPANSVLTLLTSPTVDTTGTLGVLTQGLANMNGDSAGADLLLFYCAGRRMHLGEPAASDELAEFKQRTHAAQVAGALSLGEIGGSTLYSYPLFHNATLLAARW
ncbi:MAG: histidine kinase [Comamonadaceae bacterium CG1_02_60_18]|nr:MAG: histidine kinase [Comamonadaceae bacterium CG1_02_60_18]PIQ50772.1 MAG: histidine kinase [Comamonadaceae bacterium CG12_big_fil_rev_8_21_14_0_65_59_15]